MTRNFTFSFSIKDSRFVKTVVFLFSLFPLTLQGTITLLITALALSVFGYGSLDLVVFALSICALAIVLFCLFCSIITGIVMQRRIQKLLGDSGDTATSPQNLRVEAGYPNETGFILPSMGVFPLVKIEWKLEFPSDIETRLRWDDDGQIVEEILPAKRFYTDSLVRVFTVADVLGFSHYSWRQSQQINAQALPMLDAAKQLPILRSLTSEDGIPNPTGSPEGDRMEIRPYAPGDSVRDILWKVYARNRQLNVRLAEKSVFHSKRTIAYLLSSDDDEAAAAAARIALESNALGDDWTFGADGVDSLCTTLESALVAVAKSRCLRGKHNYGLDSFLKASLAGGDAHCIIFGAAGPVPWNNALKKTFSQFPGQFSLVLALDGIKSEQDQRWWQHLLLRADHRLPLNSEKSTMADLKHNLTELGQLVESTVIVDRRSGQSFDKNLRRV
ncbi:MAG: DUF58 domain-containing protein [Pseudohongiellaceae bacterium]